MNQKLIDAMADLEEDVLFEILREEKAKGTEMSALLPDLQAGMNLIGERFSEGVYFVSELIMAGELFKDAQEILGDDATKSAASVGTFILGTVQDDIHDIGKNIVHSVLSSNGLEVVDLGVDVPPEKFVEAIRETDAKVIGLSCLLTTCFKSLKATVDAINEAGLHEGRIIIVGGGVVDEMAREYCGADFYCATAQGTAVTAIEYLKKAV